VVANGPGWYYVGNGRLRYRVGDQWTELYQTIDHPQVTAATANSTPVPAPASTRPGTRQPPPGESPLVSMVLAALRCVGIARPKPKPFYRRWWFRAPAVLAVLLIFGAANNFGDPSTKASSTSHQSGSALGGTTSAQAAPASAPARPSDQGWVLDSYRLSDHARGDFGGTVRITNTNKGAQSAVFTVFVLVKGREVASLQGSADGAAAGKTVTVHLTSQDKYKPGTYTIDFQSAVTRY
jgi:hypothetical protein